MFLIVLKFIKWVILILKVLLQNIVLRENLRHSVRKPIFFGLIRIMNLYKKNIFLKTNLVQALIIQVYVILLLHIKSEARRCLKMYALLTNSFHDFL